MMQTHIKWTSLVLTFLWSTLFFEKSQAEWVPVPLPQNMIGSTIVTTSPANARCIAVQSHPGGVKTCRDLSTTPTFLARNNNEVLMELPSGTNLKLLQVQRDADGFALQVEDTKGSKYWIFESNTSSSASMGGRSLNQSLLEVVVAGAMNPLQEVVSASTTPSEPVPCNCEDAELAQPPQIQVPDLTSGTNTGVGFHALCSGFINESGQYGELGQMVVDGLREEHRAGLYSNEHVARLTEMSSLCPNFPTFSDAQKEQFWVWTFMSIAHVESKCGLYDQGHVVGPSGHYPWGLLQMERVNQGLDGIRSIWASNPNGQSACEAPNISEHGANINCGLDAMLIHLNGYFNCSKQEHARSLRRPPTLHDWESCKVHLRSSYWQELRTHNGDITRRIKSFNACGA